MGGGGAGNSIKYQMTLDDILNHLPKLAPPELERLRQSIAALRQFTSNGSMMELESITPTDTDERLVMQAICDVLSGLGVDYPSMTFLQKTPDMPSFRGKLRGLSLYLDKSHLTKIERRAVLIVGITLLYEVMTEWGHPISARTIMRHIHKVPSVMERMFPGYAYNGKLGKLLHRGK